jgi:CelD/BcsL family acetyltransferase involved in cellulose biosynthesis
VSLTITLRAVTDWNTLGQAWRELEARADCSFFQSWTWVGCLAEERFTRPLLLHASKGDRTVALALFNHHPGWLFDTLYLQETGDPRWDAAFIEYNGVLTEAEAPPDLPLACLRAALQARLPGMRRWRGRRLVLSGVGSPQREAAEAGGLVVRQQTRIAPFVDLNTLRRGNQDYVESLSANTRAQLRRSLRLYAAHGPPRIDRADQADVAHAYLDALAVLHQAGWQRRGRPGAFANAHFARFHHALIDRAIARDEVDLLRITAGPRVIGYLYNYRYRGRALAYQSGFDYVPADRHQKPGLTSHHVAIERNLAAGMSVYDFLAGDDRYKRSLANSEVSLHWLTLGSWFDPYRLRG